MKHLAEVEALLDDWDHDRIVHTVSMGGLGPGYEQALQIAAIEMLRYYAKTQPIEPLDTNALYTKIENRLEGLGGLSGAQVGAAHNLAWIFLIRGPRAALASVPEERRTMISRHWPRAPDGGSEKA